MLTIATGAIILALSGATLLYAGARHQRLTGGTPRRGLRRIGGAALLGSLLLMLLWFGPATAVFVWMTFAMLVWSIVPLAAAWWRRPPEDAE